MRQCDTPMRDFVIDKCAWHVSAEAAEYKQRALEHFRGRYEVLLEFLRENNLLANSQLGIGVSDWSSFEIKASDLTEKGLALFKLCLPKWNVAYGQEKTQRHLTQWKRRLSELNSDA